MIVLNVRLCFHLLRMRHTVHVFHYVNFVVYRNTFFLAIPKVTIMEHELSVNESDSFNVTCKGSGNPLPRVYWNIDDIKSNATVTSSDDNMTQTLHVTNADIRDNGWISCRAENAASRTKEFVRIMIVGVYVFC